MAGFRKAKTDLAALKLGLYGLAGSGKTLTAMLIAEGLLDGTGKRLCIVDTENGTIFYEKEIPERTVHPAAFDFDVLKSRSITEISAAIMEINPDECGAIIIDSITHIWESTVEAYAGKMTKIGTIPFNAWGKIKKPYKNLITFLLNSPMHVILCGRQGNVFEDDEETGEKRKVGTKMKAEGETAHEPHILINMECERNGNGGSTIVAFVEKDRTGILTGKHFENPTYETLIKPIRHLLGNNSGEIKDIDETAKIDAEAIAVAETRTEEDSAKILSRMTSKINLTEDSKSLKLIGKEITAELKKQMLTDDVVKLRQAYLEREKQLGG